MIAAGVPLFDERRSEGSRFWSGKERHLLSGGATPPWVGMLGVVKKLGLTVLVLVGLLVSAGVVLYIYAGTEYTVCYGTFESRDAAKRAADAGRNAGLDVEVDHRATESTVTFESGETGEDAGGARRTFRAILRRERGSPGHPGGGCLERQPFD